MSQEYTEANTTMRHYSDARFKRLTVFLVATAALFGAHVKGAGDDAPWVIPVVGLFVTFSFFVMVRRVACYYWDSRTRALALEEDLGFSLHNGMGKRGFFNTSTAVYCLLLTFFGVWVFFLPVFHARRVDTADAPSGSTEVEAGTSETVDPPQEAGTNQD